MEELRSPQRQQGWPLLALRADSETDMRLSQGLTLVLLLTLLAGLFLLAWPATRTACIEGQVFDDEGPLAGARVRLKGMATRISTGADGRFHLPRQSARRRVTAWKQGYLIGGAEQTSSPLSIFLQRLPAEDNAAYQWVDPVPNAAEIQNCGNCHAAIYREWSSSGHSRSATGRHFRNLHEGDDWHGNPNVGWGLLTQYPEGAGVCASCHAPTAHHFDLRQVEGVAARGVHCDYCHKIAEVAEGTLGLSHGRYNLRLLRPSEGQLFFGSLDDVDRGEDAYSPHYRESRYCASCHEGVIFGVHVYSTFSEWLSSPARRQGKQCQDCHMKPTGRMSNFAPGHGGIERDPRTLANHRFFDGSQEAMLRRAVKASVVFEPAREGVRARVRMWTEGVGHRLPTGFVDRNVVLIVEGRDGEGRVLPPLSGPKLPPPAGEAITGRPGRLFARLLRDFDGHSPTPFWLACPDPPLDTRLAPGTIDESGFVFPRSLARLEVRVVYRRFWPQVTRTKHWPDRDLVVFEHLFLR